MGHRRIAVLTGNMADSTAQGRFTGFCDALVREGLSPPPAGMVAGGGWLQHRGSVVTKALLQLRERPTAIFSSNYMLTLGAFQVLREMGLRVPEDVSIVTFGDSAHYPFYGEGVTAVQFPIQSIADSITEYFLSR
jgi:LacI family transcriptional regulator